MSQRSFRAGVVTLVLTLPLIGTTAANRPLVDAAGRGDVATVRRLLREGADVNLAQGDGMTALHRAAERGDVSLAEILLYAGANVDAGTRIGRYTPLHVAARKGHEAMVKLLLGAGADASARTTRSGSTPLHLAAATGNGAIVSALVRAGADPDVREASWGQTPLVFAAAAGRVEAIRALLEAGADPGLASWSVDVVEREKADKASEKRLSQFLDELKKREGGGPDWRPRPSQVQAAIDAAREIQRRWPNVPDPAEEGEDDKEDEKAEEKEDESKEEKDEPKPATYGELVGAWGGLTPLLHAVRQGHVDAALALLDGGADINQPSAGDGTTPLLMAAVNGQFDLALILLERGADPNRESDAGTTPLFAVLERQWAPRSSYAHPTEHLRQKASYLDVMKALLEAGADPNVRLKKHLWYMEYTFSVLKSSGIHEKGATPFWRAAHALDVDAMRLLKDFGADPNIATIKPPKRKRKCEPKEEAEPDEAEPAESAEENPKMANAEGESAAPEETEEEEEEVEDEECKEEEDLSGVPEVPVGGPDLYPIHVASGAGYGQRFAGNAHRHVPGNWLNAVKFLVEECGADVNLRDANAYTPLHHAASRGDNALILYLVGKGADVTVVSRKGQTTADMANGPIQRVKPFPDTIALLVSLGAKNNHKCVSC